MDPWNLPKTAESVTELRRMIEGHRERREFLPLGECLLALSHLVKWVPAGDCIADSQALAEEAVDAFRLAKDQRGLVRALTAAATFCSPETRDSRLTEAREIAERSRNPELVGRVFAAEARFLGLADRERAIALHRRAIELFEACDYLPGLAQSHFGLALYTEDERTAKELAVRAARLYAEIGVFDEAARSLSIALVQMSPLQDADEMEAISREALGYAVLAKHTRLEQSFAFWLSLVAVAKHDLDRAKSEYARSVREEDEALRTDPDLRRSRVLTLRRLIRVAKESGHQAAVEHFTGALKAFKVQN